MAKIREVAVIDLGSNSFHLIIARIVNGAVQVLSRLKRTVRLAEGLDENGVLDQAAIERGKAVLALFAQRLVGFPAENVKVVGTYTLRRAVNNADFLQQVATVFPYPIHIISGVQEATFIYSGVSHTYSEQGRKLVIDIGGGSTEMVIGDDFTPLLAESKHMGCVSFAKRFFTKGEISLERFEQAKAAAKAEILPILGAYQQAGWVHTLGSSGTIKTVVQVLLAQGFDDGVITPKRLHRLITQVLACQHFSQLKLAGLRADRTAVFVPGLAILSAIFDSFGLQSMCYSEGALREGIIYQFDEKFQVTDVRERTLASLLCFFHLDQAQIARVQASMQQLASDAALWQKNTFTHEVQQILQYAVKMHEVGIIINHDHNERHAAYILEHLNLPGFDRIQKALLCELVRYYRQKLPKNLPHLQRYSRENILTALMVFRLAVLLNNSRQASAVDSAIILQQPEPFMWQLNVPKSYLQQNPLVKIDLNSEQQFWQESGLGQLQLKIL